MKSQVVSPLPIEFIEYLKKKIDSGYIYQILSLGAGVNSGTLFEMNLKGLIKPKADFAIFSDTMQEKKTNISIPRLFR